MGGKFTIFCLAGIIVELLFFEKKPFIFLPEKSASSFMVYGFAKKVQRIARLAIN
jgi:hypothetical protein